MWVTWNPGGDASFNKKLKNVSCEYDRVNGWNSTLQAAWYIRYARIIWFLWTKRTIWSLILSFTLNIVRALKRNSSHHIMSEGKTIILRRHNVIGRHRRFANNPTDITPMNMKELPGIKLFKKDIPTEIWHSKLSINNNIVGLVHKTILSSQSWVSTIQTVVLTADVFQLFLKKILCIKKIW